MRFSLLALASILGFSPAPVPQEMDDVLNEYELQIKADLWKGFKEGSWVQRKIHHKDNGGERTNEYRITLDRIAENGYCFKVETMKDGKAVSSRLMVKQIYGDPAAIYESDKKEDVKIGNTNFSCFVQEYKTEGENGTLQRTHESKEAPGVVVRTLYEAMYEGKKITIKQDLVALDVEQKVGEAKVKCWKVEKTTDMPKGKIVALFSSDVPGGTVRREAASEIGDYKAESLDEVTGFEAKK